MIGDKLVITDIHRENGRRIALVVNKSAAAVGRLFCVTIAGESGSGKTEIAATTAEELEKSGLRVVIVAQDDYFDLPPKSNMDRRRQDISFVGTQEVKLDLLDAHLQAAKGGVLTVTKPLVFFEENRIGSEKLSFEGANVLICEGTYTTLLEETDLRVFINLTYHDTLDDRKRRARDDVNTEFINRVLEIEHQIISNHRTRADLVLEPPEQKD